MSEPTSADGALLFARYAYPPNALGYCGPDAGRTLLEYGAAAASDGGLALLARGFEGAWPYLRLIAEANRIPDPLDRRVVEAYWVGNRLLEHVDAAGLGEFLSDRFRPRAGRRWDVLAETALAGAAPHHNFHVFGVYPWVGLLRLGHTGEPLRILDRCRIRWGRVTRVEGSRARVRTPELAWDGGDLALGPIREEWALLSSDGLGFVRGLGSGEFVSLHWDWVCDRLTEPQVAGLRRYTLRALRAGGRGVGELAPNPPPGPTAVTRPTTG